mgnify:CR=1 FL=1
MQLFRTKGQAQNLAKSQDGPGQPIKILVGTVLDFDSCPVPSCGTKRDRAEGRPKTGKGSSKTEKVILNQEGMF